MSGFEVAGLVLGAIPLVISTLKHHKKSSRIIVSRLGRVHHPLNAEDDLVVNIEANTRCLVDGHEVHQLRGRNDEIDSSPTFYQIRPVVENPPGPELMRAMGVMAPLRRRSPVGIRWM
ncbi:hypothetical protein F4819DRAFT_459216 [Hypoxylon fuscum]|nr:hypothetical protein F4819DRAFT_459216 [Hypoxylon fuscum]